jgi:hypothetical protein
MKTLQKTIQHGLVVAALSLAPAHAAVTIYETGSINAELGSGSYTLDNLTLNTTTDTAVFLLYSADAVSITSATFAGEAMTVIDDGGNARATIAYLANPSNLSGDLVINGITNNAPLELAYWGVAGGIDTSAITTTTGSTGGGGNQTITPYSSLLPGAVTYSVFSDNNNSSTAYSGGLISHDGGGADHDAIITTDTVLTAGSFTPTTSWTTDGSPVLFGASISFVPEPSSITLLGLGGGLALLRRKRS